MKYWYSESKKGFFNNLFYGEHQLPHDCVELTQDEYLYLISQNQKGLPIVSENGKPKITVTNRN